MLSWPYWWAQFLFFLYIENFSFYAYTNEEGCVDCWLVFLCYSYYHMTHPGLIFLPQEGGNKDRVRSPRVSHLTGDHEVFTMLSPGRFISVSFSFCNACEGKNALSMQRCSRPSRDRECVNSSLSVQGTIQQGRSFYNCVQGFEEFPPRGFPLRKQPHFLSAVACESLT